MEVLVVSLGFGSGRWSIYLESGQAVEHGFNSEAEAVEFAIDNGYVVVELFSS